MRMDESTPRGACRVASIVSSPKVPAVSNPKTMKAAMKKPSANVAGRFPLLRHLRAFEAAQDVDRLDVGEDQQQDREHEHPQDLGRDADVVQDRQQPDAIGVDERS